MSRTSSSEYGVECESASRSAATKQIHSGKLTLKLSVRRKKTLKTIKLSYKFLLICLNRRLTVGRKMGIPSSPLSKFTVENSH